MTTVRLKLEYCKDIGVSDNKRKYLFPVIKLEVADGTKLSKQAIHSERVKYYLAEILT